MNNNIHTHANTTPDIQALAATVRHAFSSARPLSSRFANEALDALVARCEELEEQKHTCEDNWSRAGKLLGETKERLAEVERERDRYRIEADALFLEVDAEKARADKLEAALKEIASYTDDGDRNDDIVSGYNLAKTARAALAGGTDK